MEVTLFVCLLSISITYALVAYDCGSIESTVAEISLLDAKACVKKSKNITSSNQLIQLIQPRTYDEIKYEQCLIEIEHMVYRCGKTIDTFAKNPIYDELFHLGKEDCHTLIKDRYFYYSGIKIEIPQHLTQVFSNIETLGYHDGSTCYPGNPTVINGVLHDRPVRSSKFKISISVGTATLDLEEGKLITEGGLKCKYSEGHCFSANYGDVYWNHLFVQNHCSNQNFIPIYEGYANEVIEYHKEGITHSFILHYDNYDFQIITTGKKTLICGQEALLTEHPKLSIIKKPADLPFLLKYESHKLNKNTNIMTYINSKFIYTMQHIKNQLNELYTSLSYARCMTENNLVKTILSSAKTSPQEFAYQYFGHEGYTATVRGEVVYIMKCTAVSVNFTRLPECYQEIPVTYKDSLYFVSPRSRMLTTIGVKVDCSNIFPIKFKLQNTWYTISSLGISASPEPSIMDISSTEDWEFKNIKGLAESGIYTPEDMDNIEKIMLASARETAINNQVARVMAGDDHPSDIIKFQNLMTPEDVLKFGKSQWSILWDKFIGKLGFFGQTCSALIGIIVLIKTIVFIINSIISIRILTNIFGLSWKILFFWWDHVVHIFLHNELKRPKKEYDTELKEVPTAPLGDDGLDYDRFLSIMKK